MGRGGGGGGGRGYCGQIFMITGQEIKIVEVGTALETCLRRKRGYFITGKISETL